MATQKTAEEIKILQEGGKRLASVLKKVVDAVEPGVSSSELNTIAETAIEALGDTPAFLHYTPSGATRPYPAALCVSVNDEIVHGIPNEEEKILHEGDIVSFDIGLIHQDLVTDSAYTVGVGEISSEDETLMEVARESLFRGIDAARVGNHVGDIGHAIASFVEQHGYAIFKELVGHGVGYEIHEDPHIPNVGKPGAGAALRPGMVVAIEPMIGRGGDVIELLDDGYTYRTKDGSRSAHFEHTIAITEEDPIIITQWEE